MITALQAAARAARHASMPIDGPRGVAIVLVDEGLAVRGWDRSAPKAEVSAIVVVSWLEFAANNDLVGNAVALVVERLDKAVQP